MVSAYLCGLVCPGSRPVGYVRARAACSEAEAGTLVFFMVVYSGVLGSR